MKYVLAAATIYADRLDAPNDVRALRAAWGVRVGLPATKLMLEAGAVLMRTETELVLKRRRVIPGRLLEHGFAFQHPDWPAAARELCAARRAG